MKKSIRRTWHIFFGRATPLLAWRRRAILVKFIVIFLSASYLPGCRITNSIEDAKIASVNVIANAIDALGRESGNWRAILQDAENQLLQLNIAEEVRSTLRNEIANITSRSISQAGVEVKCVADFVGDRVREQLVRIRAKLLLQHAPPVEPKLCNVVPIAVERSIVPNQIKALEFYGYDFDSSNSRLHAFLERSNSAPIEITGKLDRPTHYAMTLKFGGGGVQLDELSERIVLRLGDTEVSSIAVIQPQTLICDSVDKIIPLNPITYTPPHVGRGDADFGGNGPRVSTKVWLEVKPQFVRVYIHMIARETKSDWTEASGMMYRDIFFPDFGWRIETVIGRLEDAHSYVDTDHDDDPFEIGSGGPVKRLVYVGDTRGAEAGTKTKVTVEFNELRVRLVRTGNCVPADTAIHMDKTKHLQEGTFVRWRVGINKVRQQRSLPALQ